MKQEVSPKLVIAVGVLIVGVLGAAIWWRTGVHTTNRGPSPVATLEQTPQFKAQVEAEEQRPSRHNLSKAAIETAETMGAPPR